MGRDELIVVIIEFVTEVQSLSEEDCPEVSANTIPHNDLMGFDSLRSLEVLAYVSGRLPKLEGKDFGNIFAQDQRPVSIETAVDTILEQIEG